MLRAKADNRTTNQKQNKGNKRRARDTAVIKTLQSARPSKINSQNFNKMRLNERMLSNQVQPMIKHHYSEVKPDHGKSHVVLHKKENSRNFKEELEECIHSMESRIHSYANTLLYPEVCMSRIPFLCPVPTALCRGISLISYTIDPSQGDTFAWSFVPEALLRLSPNTAIAHYPFHFAMATNPTDEID